MDKNIHPLAAFLVILISVVSIATWFWARGEAREFGGPAGLTTDPDGHLYIQIRNQLLEHDADGNFVARHDLSEFGIDVVLGGTDFFSDGDILIRRGPDTRSLIDTIRAYQRKTNAKSLEPDAADTGLYRCNLDTASCSVFGPSAIDFKSAFSVFIDRESDDVYVSDSSRHRVRKYTRDGIEAAAPAEGFRFPNQLMLHGEQLFVADTNNHRIRVVRAESGEFGDAYYDADVVPPQAKNDDETWPSHFVRAGDNWWVNNMKSGMDYGGIYVFDDDWQFRRKIPLPGEPDPIALVVFNDEVLISDWYGDRVHRVSLDGEVLGAFTSPGLSRILEESRAERRVFTSYAWLAAVLGIVMVAILVIKGTDWKDKRPPADDAGSTPPGEPLLLEPDKSNVEKIRSNMRLGRWLMLPLAVVMPTLIYLAGETKIVLDLTIGGVAFVAVYFLVEWMMRVNTATSIYFDGDRVMLGNHEGAKLTYPPSKVYYTRSVVASDEIAVFLGQGQLPIYDLELTMRELEQRLPPSQRISEWAMQKKLLAMRHPNGIIAIAALIGMVFVALLLVAQ